MTIAYITDLHIDEANPAALGADTRRNWLLIYQSLIQHNVDMVVLGGDLGVGDAVPWLLNFMQGYQWHVTPGNHDNREVLRQFYHNSETDVRHALYFGFDKDGYRYLFLDTQPDALDDIQMDWLRTYVQTELPLVVFIHHPVLAVDTWVDVHYPLKNREEVESVLRMHNGPVTIFCGHYHLAHTTQSGNITQHICPAVSFSIRLNPDVFEPDTTITGYQMIYLDASGIKKEVITLEL